METTATEQDLDKLFRGLACYVGERTLSDSLEDKIIEIEECWRDTGFINGAHETRLRHLLTRLREKERGG